MNGTIEIALERIQHDIAVNSRHQNLGKFVLCVSRHLVITNRDSMGSNDFRGVCIYVSLCVLMHYLACILAFIIARLSLKMKVMLHT